MRKILIFALLFTGVYGHNQAPKDDVIHMKFKLVAHQLINVFVKYQMLVIVWRIIN